VTALIVLLAALNAAPVTPVTRVPPVATGEQIAVFAGGCFWGVEAVFEHVKGVSRVTSGYAGGSVASPSYEDVSSGSTGHAESVQVVFDPAQISYGTLMQIFFSVAHDPTQLNRQGPDDGTQYRSAIFYVSEDQKREAEAYVAQLTKAKTFPRPIVTQIAPLPRFYPAEDYHQDFAEKHPMHPYILINDRPKVIALKRQFPQLYREIGKSVATDRGSK
jgi:peptide-methionine (S)-S-oxide reductase